MAERLVRVHDLTPRGYGDGRLSVVSDLCPAREAIPDGYAPFLPDAVAPRGEWRDPTTDELSRLLGISGVNGESDLLVISLPRLAHVLSDHLGCLGDFSSTQKAVHDVAFLHALDACVDDLIPFCVCPDNLLCQGAWVNAGRMRLVTHNMVLVPPRRIGLHVDNWDDLPLFERARGRRRLCVNIGLRPRYLIFLQMALSALVAAGKLPREIPKEVSPAMLIRAHLSGNLKQLAARVRIDPGEAYIVNADDVIHDGASDAHDAPDVALHFLGHFGPETSSR
jgi:hypothetical protein